MKKILNLYRDIQKCLFLSVNFNFMLGVKLLLLYFALRIPKAKKKCYLTIHRLTTDFLYKSIGIPALSMAHRTCSQDSAGGGIYGLNLVLLG